MTAVSEAADALIIPTHGFGITEETWGVIEKAYNEKGLVILTDPDHAGEEIRRRLAERFPDSIQAYMARDDARDGDDIGIENAKPEAIAEALEKALNRDNKRRAQQNCPSASAPGGSFASSSGAKKDKERRTQQNCPSASAPGGNFATRCDATVEMGDLRELGLCGSEGSSELRAAVTKALGIGYCNAGAMIKKLRGFGIGLDELKEEIEKIRK